MAKQAACDACGKTSRLDFLDQMPRGWFTVTEREPANEAEGTVTLCSLECVGDYADKQLIARGERSPVPAEPGQVARVRRLPGGHVEAGHVRAAQADSSDQ